MEKRAIVFTDWNVVVKIDDDKNECWKTSDYLEGLLYKINGSTYSVFYGPNKRQFIITEDGLNYKVVLPPNDQNELSARKYSSLVSCLLYLSTIDKRFDESNYLKAYKIGRIERLDDATSYEDFSVSELEFYKDILRKRLNEEKYKEDTDDIRVKISDIVIIIENKKKEDNSCSKIFETIHNLVEESKKLDVNDQNIVLDRAETILNSYSEYKKEKSDVLLNGEQLPENIVNQLRELKLFINRPLDETEDNTLEIVHNTLIRLIHEQEEEKEIGGK